MELGIGFAVGIFAGAVVSVIVALIIAVSRRAIKTSAKTRIVEMKAIADAAAQSAASDAAPEPPAPGTGQKPEGTRRQPGRNTIVVGAIEQRDQQLNKSIQEVRDLLLQLATVISATESASGEAADSFSTARRAIRNLGDVAASSELAEAQRVLVEEIDRVIRSNAKLHTELDRANQGIAEQRRQIEELRVQARIDGLTRIPNRSAFDERLAEYISLLARANLTVSLLLLDVDFFKRVNDVYGHVNGDRVLRGVAARISDAVRQNDFAARYGGEEFAVIFPATDVKDAYQVADRLRQDIAKTNFRLDDQVVKMTISGGLAQCRPGMTAEHIVQEADAALYQAKDVGRNRILIAGANKPERADEGVK
ncbi:MAG: GGDEF domain-containing protein [Planctomycetes bacterium]|nr:GGDEF domain-containing protein [Planctomycetota bacterium]